MPQDAVISLGFAESRGLADRHTGGALLLAACDLRRVT